MNKTLLILAGGFGTRLKSAVADVPKALAPVGARPFLYLQLKNWLSLGLNHFIFSLHHESQQIIDFLKSEKQGLLKDASIEWVVEPEPLGTGGAIAYTLEVTKLKGEFFMTNADTWLGDGFSSFKNIKSPAMGIVHLENASRYGKVLMDEHHYVTSFVEKSPKDQPGWINAGVSLFHSDIFKDWDGQPFSLETCLLPQLVKDGSIKAVPLNTDFIDIGIPEDYQRFCEWARTEKGDITRESL